MTSMIKWPSKDFDQKMENKLLPQYSYILQAEVKLWELIMVTVYLYQFSRTNHLLLHKNFGIIFLEIIRHITPWNTWRKKATRNVYKPNKTKMKNYCKITPGTWKTWQSYSIFWVHLQCFTKVHRLPKTQKSYLKCITDDFSHVLTDLFLEVIVSSHWLRL